MKKMTIIVKIRLTDFFFRVNFHNRKFGRDTREMALYLRALCALPEHLGRIL